MITNLHDVANHMMTTFRGLVCEHRPMPNNPDGERLAAHFANVVSSQKVEVVGDPNAERLVVVKQ
jgi:predicted regulator of Ras-like GTPase activity (Roadblock/LC7/MglB family)